MRNFVFMLDGAWNYEPRYDTGITSRLQFESFGILNFFFKNAKN